MRRHGLFRSRIVSGVALAGLALSLSACGGGSDAETGEGGDGTFDVLAVLSLDGPAGTLGKNQQLGLKSAVNYLNANGGIGGQDIEVTILNDGGNPTTAISELRKYLAKEGKPDALVAGSSGTTAGALLPIAAQEGILSMNIADGNLLVDGKKFPQQYLPYKMGEMPVGALVNWLSEQGYQKIGVLQLETGFTASQAPILNKALADAGIEQKTVTFSADVLDLSSQVAQLKDFGSEAVVAALLGPAVGYALDARAKLGWDAPFLGDTGFATTDLTNIPTDQLKDVYAVVFPNMVWKPESERSEGWNLLLEQLEKDGVEISAALNQYSFIWDGLMALDVAAEQAGSTEVADMVEALNDLEQTSDPRYATVPEIAWTEEVHQNVLITPESYPIVPEGPMVDGMIKAPDAAQ